MADANAIEMILEAEYTPAQLRAAKALVESCMYTTTALAALATAVDEMGSEAQAGVLRRACNELALVESEEL